MSEEAKVAVITGASRGIGRAAALRLAKHGVRLIVAARTVAKGDSVWPGSLEETAADARALGAEVSAVKCDVTVRAEVENLYNFALEKYRRVDILINNAIYYFRPPPPRATRTSSPSPNSVSIAGRSRWRPTCWPA